MFGVRLLKRKLSTFVLSKMIDRDPLSVSTARMHSLRTILISFASAYGGLCLHNVYSTHFLYIPRKLLATLGNVVREYLIHRIESVKFVKKIILSNLSWKFS